MTTDTLAAAISDFGVAAKAKSGKVTDFGSGHPEFRLSLLDAKSDMEQAV